MTYKTILVHVNDERRCDHLLKHATALAERFEAHLIGLFVAPQPLVMYAEWPSVGMADVIEEVRRAHADAGERMRINFNEATRTLARPSEWRFAQSLFANVGDDVIAAGRNADLIVASQADPEWHMSGDLDVPDRLAIESGRPVLVIPNNAKQTLSAHHITVGWNEKREGARAVFDALPFLIKAECVNVVWVNPVVGGILSGDTPGYEASWAEATDIGAGAELLRLATAYGSDLLVMGAYGHSRWSEFILGGASHHVFAKATIPVLMSH
jgi:nucleotide-binding universal stress UspA family protein